jgi:hypothetical protein
MPGRLSYLSDMIVRVMRVNRCLAQIDDDQMNLVSFTKFDKAIETLERDVIANLLADPYVKQIYVTLSVDEVNYLQTIHPQGHCAINNIATLFPEIPNEAPAVLRVYQEENEGTYHDFEVKIYPLIAEMIQRWREYKPTDKGE